jgi:UDP-GlcNAc:undecaprenyl-phosphate GlcNAc-1-phosphate transferase
VVFSRLAEGHPVFLASKNHTSHRLMSIGLTQRKTLLVMYSASVFFGLVALVTTAVPVTTAWIIAGVSLILITIIAGVMVYIRQHYRP